MSKYYVKHWGFLLTWLIIMFGSIYGWFNNIFKLMAMHDVMTGEGFIRVAGIFVAPLGAVMGYF